MTRFDVLIVGAGHAGAQTAIALRQRDFTGSIGMLSLDPEWPYERPPLSKEYLADEKAFERLLVRPPSFWSENRVDFFPEREVVAVDASRKRVQTSAQEQFEYGNLVWAAGGAPRQLACVGHSLPGVHTIRSRADVDRLRSELSGSGRIVIIGGGYIGLESAASLRKLGKEVVLLEALDRVLARVAAEPISRFFEHEHRARGVDVRTGISVECIEERDGRACAVRLCDGTTLPADIVIVGVGIIPQVEPLSSAGAVVTNGVRVDRTCRTNLPDVFAIGDCALHPNSYSLEPEVRIESVQNAHDQAIVVAQNILGHDTQYNAVPWFWSNQFELRLQTVGLSAGYERIVLRGKPEQGSFSVIYLREGRVLALDCVNSVKDFTQGKRLVAERAIVDPSALSDATVPLKLLAA